MATFKTDCYLQVKPVMSRYIDNKIDRVVVVKSTQQRPAKPEPGCVVVKLTLEIDEQIVAPSIPAVQVVINNSTSSLFGGGMVVDQEAVWDGT